MKKKDTQTQITSAISGSIINLVGLFYVHDSDLLVIGKEEDDEVSITHKLQQNISLWKKALFTSGGALKAEKCNWTLISFTWMKGR